MFVANCVPDGYLRFSFYCVSIFASLRSILDDDYLFIFKLGLLGFKVKSRFCNLSYSVLDCICVVLLC